jgi:hypothetical protein
MKTAVALTPENTAVLAWCSELTGLPAEELINFFLAEYFENFNEDNQDNFCEETIGLLKFKDRESAARTLAWIERRVRKGHKGNRYLKAQLTNCRTDAFRLTLSKPGATANASGFANPQTKMNTAR